MYRIFFIFLFVGNVLLGQQSIDLQLMGHYNSTGIVRQIPDAFFYGGTIDSAAIDKSYESLNQRNNFGLLMGGYVIWKSPWKLPLAKDKLLAEYQWTFSIGAQQYTGLHFSKDAFGLFFKGGLPYLGDTLQLNPLLLESTSFSKVGIGLSNPSTASSILLNFVQVQNHFAARLNQATWFQDDQTAQISLDLDGTSNLGSPSLGFGLALDIDYRFGSDTEEEDEQEFQLLVQNLGAAYIPSHQSYAINGTMQLSAMPISWWQNKKLDELGQQILDSLGFEKKVQSSWILMPASILLAKRINEEPIKKIQAYYGAQMLLRQSYTPFVYAGAHIKAKQFWQTGVGLAYGGFGGLRAQAYSILKFNNKQLILRSDNITLHNGASLLIQFRCEF